MLRIVLRVLAVLLLAGGLLGSAIAGYLLLTPSEEQLSYEQKYREMTERYAKARAAKDPFEKARLLKEAEEAAGWAKEWGEGARARRVWHLVGAGVGVAVVFVSFVVFLLTFVGRKAGAAPA